MEKKQAIAIANILEKWAAKTPSLAYELNKLETIGNKLHQFHQWSNGKPLVAGYNVTKIGINNYYLLFIDWHRNDNYYLVLYTANKSTTLAEIRQLVEIDGKSHLQWKYNPLKRDGKNDQRKAFFKQMFGSLMIQIELPTGDLDVEPFFDQLFRLCSNRVKADQIVDVFPLER